jgi:replicative DNA helicase
VRNGAHPTQRVWPTGCEVLDQALAGGFRSGELILLAGPHGLGKTTWAMQVARNVARGGRSVVVFSFEHDLPSLLIRLVALEAGLLSGPEAPSINRIRQSFEASDGLTGSLQDRLTETHGGGKALDVVREYAERVVLHRSTGSSTSLDSIRDAIADVRAETGQPPMVVVDYLQKVYGPGVTNEQERITGVVEGLKDLSIESDIPILAVVAYDKEGLEVGKRMRVQNMRGSASLAYEADTVLLLNNKFDIVARHHLVYDIGNAERFRNWVVLTVEKNRNGQAGIDLEFRKRFDQARFEPDGQQVTEKLVDERIFVE